MYIISANMKSVRWFLIETVISLLFFFFNEGYAVEQNNINQISEVT